MPHYDTTVGLWAPSVLAKRYTHTHRRWPETNQTQTQQQESKMTGQRRLRRNAHTHDSSEGTALCPPVGLCSCTVLGFLLISTLLVSLISVSL